MIKAKKLGVLKPPRTHPYMKECFDWNRSKGRQNDGYPKVIL